MTVERAGAHADRRCACGTVLARDHEGLKCSGCQRRAGALDVPPVVPFDFWAHLPLAEALAAAHMGRVLRAYRHHWWHGRTALPQPVAGAWLGLAQSQLSRIENGPASMDLTWLIFVARTLMLPLPLLWFRADIGGETLDGRRGLRLVPRSGTANDAVRAGADLALPERVNLGGEVATVRLDVAAGASVAVTVEADSGPVHLVISTRDTSDAAEAHTSSSGMAALHAVAEPCDERALRLGR